MKVELSLNMISTALASLRESALREPDNSRWSVGRNDFRKAYLDAAAADLAADEAPALCRLQAG